MSLGIRSVVLVLSVAWASGPVFGFGPPIGLDASDEPVNTAAKPGSAASESGLEFASGRSNTVLAVDAWSGRPAPTVPMPSPRGPLCPPTPVVPLPFIEDFEAELTCGTSCGDACPLSGPWQNVLNDDRDWTVDSGGTGSAGTGPLAANSGANYLYIESSGAACQNAVAVLLSPTFDFSAVASPAISFAYHMFGATIGTLNVDVSTDNCLNWTTESTLVGQQQAAQADPFLVQVVSLSAYAGNSNVRIRFHYTSGTSFTGDAALDDIQVGEGAARCCDLLGMCSILDFTACTAIGGTYTGGADCTAACPQPGACCNSNGSGCGENVLQSHCAGDRWEEGVSCTAMSPPCAEDLGACCLSTGCQEGVTGNACFTMSGVWLPGVCAGVFCEDNCGTPRILVDGVLSNFDTTGATTDGPLDPAGACADVNVGTNDIWFRYTVPAGGGALTATLCGSGYDATLQLYSKIDPMTGLPAPIVCADITVPPNPDVTELCDDDGCGLSSGPSILAGILATGGQEYLIRVGGWQGATGAGDILVSTIAIATGACCKVDGTCAIEPVANCLFPDAYFEQQPCGVATCGEIGGCCLGLAGCEITFENTCALGGTFLGVGTDCGPGGPGPGAFCSGGLNLQNDFCMIAAGQADDCDNDGVPDNCTIFDCIAAPAPGCSDCDSNNVLDRCEITSCPMDLNDDEKQDGADLAGFIDELVSPVPTCPTAWTREYGASDVDNNGIVDFDDIDEAVAVLLEGAGCTIPRALTTTFASNGNGNIGAGIYFDLDVGPNGPIEVTGLDMNSASPAGTAFTLDVYTVPGAALGNVLNMAAWTLVSSGSGTTAGYGVPSPVTLNNTFVLPAGSSWGIAYVPTGVSNARTNGNGANEVYMDGTALTLTACCASNVPFTAPVFSPRVVNTTLYYDGPRQP